MNGNIGINYVCKSCGKDLFLKAIAGKFVTIGEDTYTQYTEYEKIPDGWDFIAGNLICPDCKKRVFYRESKTKTLWARLGATLDLTEAQYNDIMNAENDQDTAFKAFKAVIDAGSFKIDGDCYIPGEDGEEIAEFDI